MVGRRDHIAAALSAMLGYAAVSRTGEKIVEDFKFRRGRLRIGANGHRVVVPDTTLRAGHPLDLAALVKFFLSDSDKPQGVIYSIYSMVVGDVDQKDEEVNSLDRDWLADVPD